MCYGQVASLVFMLAEALCHLIAKKTATGQKATRVASLVFHWRNLSRLTSDYEFIYSRAGDKK